MSKEVMSIFVALFLLSCSEEGTENGDSKRPDAASTDEAVTPNPNSLLGVISVRNAAERSVMLRLALLDHSNSNFLLYDVADGGTFQIPLAQFSQGDIYSLALMTENWKFIGDVNIRPDAGAPIYGFTYAPGEPGFEMDEVTVTTDELGRISKDQSTLGAYVGGGFSPADGTYRLVDFVPQKPFATATIGINLIPKTELEVLNAFYLSETYPGHYRTAIVQSASYVFKSRASTEATVKGAKVNTGPTWLDTVDHVDSQGKNLGRWSKSDFELAELSSFVHQSTVLATTGMPTNSLFTFGLYTEGRGEARALVLVDSCFAMIPRILGAWAESQSEYTISYEDTSTANGLTRPLAWVEGGLNVRIQGPRDCDDKYLGSDVFDRILVSIRYFGISDSGVVEEIIRESASFPKPFNQRGAIGTNRSISRRWDPGTATMTYNISAEELAGSSEFEISIDEGALGYTQPDIERIRIDIAFVNAEDKVSTILWLGK